MEKKNIKVKKEEKEKTGENKNSKEEKNFEEREQKLTFSLQIKLLKNQL